MKKITFLFFLFSILNFSQDLTYKDSVNQNQQLENLYNGTIEANIDSKNLLNEEIKNLNLIDNSNVYIPNFILNLFLTALLSIFLSYTYSNYGNSISNRKQFSKNFLMLSLTTMLVITVVKSSLALSLGLVGALSIIRFRSAIKEPEELTYLFLAISIGLGFGANQTLITIVAILIILFFIILLKKYNSTYYDNQNLFISLSSVDPSSISSNQVLDIAVKYCKNVNLRRIDESSDFLEISISVELDDFKDIDKIKKELLGFDKNLKFTFLDNKGIIG
jgi:uncharacterized membrane protein YhiD involved in acid resistance